VHLLVKNLGRQMLDSVVREELEALGIRVQGFLQHRSARRDHDTSKDRPLTSRYTVSVAGGPENPESAIFDRTLRPGLRVTVDT
jgi:hypothetical protein